MRPIAVITLTFVASAAWADDAIVKQVTTAIPENQIVLTARAESFGMPVRPHINVDALARTVTFEGNGAEEAARRVASKSQLCPQRDPNNARAVICTTQRLMVRWSTPSANLLSVEETLGAPITKDDSQAPRVFDDPVVLDLGGPCPGDTAAAMGACALNDGNLSLAKKRLKEAFNSEPTALAPSPYLSYQKEYAALRLGDLAAVDDKVEDAAWYWGEAGRTGPFSRLAAMRLCELRGTCFDPRHARGYDVTTHVALPRPLEDEMVLRVARAHAFDGHIDDAVKLVMREGRGTAEVNLCGHAPFLCQRIALHALIEAREGRADAVAALALFHVLPDRTRGPRAVALHDAAADISATLGAPAYGAAALSSVAGLVDKGALPSHLAKTATLFVDGDDVARAEIVLSFAKEEYGRTNLYSKLFQPIESRLKTRTKTAEEDPDADVEKARALLSRIQALGSSM